MKILTTRNLSLCFAMALWVAAPCASAQNIYKCTRAGVVEYTDQPCPAGKGELLHKADDGEIIDQYLRLGQQDEAQRYAQSHHIEALYQQRLDAHQQAQDEKAQRQADEFAAAQQREDQAREQAQRQAQSDDVAAQEKLLTENEALRQQNADYRDQLNQPIPMAPPVYWNTPQQPPRYDPDYRPEQPNQPNQPIFHPCKQLAGGRVEC